MNGRLSNTRGARRSHLSASTTLVAANQAITIWSVVQITTPSREPPPKQEGGQGSSVCGLRQERPYGRLATGQPLVRHSPNGWCASRHTATLNAARRLKETSLPLRTWTEAPLGCPTRDGWCSLHAAQQRDQLLRAADSAVESSRGLGIRAFASIRDLILFHEDDIRIDEVSRV